MASKQVFSADLQGQLRNSHTFSTREVGLNHPDAPGYIRITDTGDIMIMADDGLGLIFNYKNRSCTILADTIRFITTDNEGLAWNSLFFNKNATTYSQATFNAPTGTNVKNVFDGTENYYNIPDISPAANTSQDTSTASVPLPSDGTQITPFLPSPPASMPKSSSPPLASP